MTRVVLVRHGQSIWNAAGIYQGQAGPGLTALGREQARLVAEHAFRRYDDVGLIAHSDLERVVETAAPTVQRLAAPVRTDPRLREIDLGPWTGRSHDEVAASDPGGMAAWRRWERTPGEGLPDFRARARAALADLLDLGGTVLVFTHGGVIRVLIGAALGLDHERRLVPAGNGSLTGLHARDGEVRLTSYNETAHLVVHTTSPTASPVG